MARFKRLLRRALLLFAGLALLGIAALGILYWLIAPRLPDVQELRNVQLQVPLQHAHRNGGHHTSTTSERLALDTALVGADLHSMSVDEIDEVDVDSRISEHGMRPQSWSETPNRCSSYAFGPGKDEVRDTDQNSESLEVSPVDLDLQGLGSAGWLEGQGHGGDLPRGAWNEAGPGLHNDLVFGPAEVASQAHGTPGAIEAEARSAAIGIEVPHARPVRAAVEDKQAVGTQRQAATTPGANLVRLWVVDGLDERQKVVAASG